MRHQSGGARTERYYRVHPVAVAFVFDAPFPSLSDLLAFVQQHGPQAIQLTSKTLCF